MKRIYITGAKGFTGQHVVPALKGYGYQVVPSHANLLDAKALTEELREAQPTHVLHLAAIAYVGHADIKEMYLTNILGTRNLLEALKSIGGLHKVVLASSANVYGNSQNSPLNESEPTSPANDYAVSKLAMEYVTQLYASKVPVVIARPFNYTGPGQSADFLIPKLVTAFKRRDPLIELGNLGVYREFNDVRLLCAAYVLLLEHGTVGSLVNVCSGQLHALRDVILMLRSLTQHEPEILVNPAFVRSNEVLRLGGDPSRLLTLASEHSFKLPSYSLHETLAWMLA